MEEENSNNSSLRQPADRTIVSQAKKPVWLWIGLGVLALIIIAGLVFVFLKPNGKKGKENQAASGQQEKTSEEVKKCMEDALGRERAKAIKNGEQPTAEEREAIDKCNASNQSKKDTDGKDINLALASDLPTCPSDTSTIFTKAFMDGDKPDFIIPLGNSGQSGHVVPVDHVYPNSVGNLKDVPVYAPADLTLIKVENKQMHNKSTDAITRADFQLNFAPCRGLNLAFTHIRKLSEKINAAIKDENSNCDNRKLDYGEQEGIPTYYVVCNPKFEKVKISAGELIGYISGQSDKKFTGFDIGLYDYNKPEVGFVNPLRYYDDTNHTACFADYYTPELRAKYYAKFGNIDENEGRIGNFAPVSGEPKCGKVMHDVAGTAAGDWFKNKIERNNETDNEALILIHDNLNPEMAKLSMAGVTSFIFTPTHTGTTNREFSEVTADGKIYCYQGDGNGEMYTDNIGRRVPKETGKYLLQLVDDTHIKAEQQSGACLSASSSGTGAWQFSNPVIYER